jgi:hypothetical protein
MADSSSKSFHRVRGNFLTAFQSWLTSAATKWINFVMGVLPGWWLGESDDRFPDPYVTSTRWDKELRNAGFAGIDAVAHDGYLNNNIIAVPSYLPTRSKRVTLLCGKIESETVLTIEHYLSQSGYELDRRSIDDIPAPEQDIVSALDLDGPFFHEMTEKRLGEFIHFLSNIKDSGMLWVTGACQIACNDPRYAMVLGLARVIRTEMGLDFATLELESFEETAFNSIPYVVQEFQKRLNEPNVNPTVEWAFANGSLQISRYHYIQVLEELKENSNDTPRKKLELRRPGFPDSLYWKVVEKPEMEEDEVEVDIRAVGLNFKVFLVFPS